MARRPSSASPAPSRRAKPLGSPEKPRAVPAPKRTTVLVKKTAPRKMTGGRMKLGVEPTIRRMK